MAGTLNNVMGLGTTLIAVPPGATQAVLVTAVSGQIYTRLKYQSGGTLEIIGVADGATLTAAQLVSNSGGHYLVGSAEAPIVWEGAPRFYLSSLSATTVVMMIRGLSSGV